MKDGRTEKPADVNPQSLHLTAKLRGQTKEDSCSLMHLRAGQKVLGVGRADTIHLARLVGPTGRVIGIDSDARMIQEATCSAAQQGVTKWTSHAVADATSLSFDVDSYDACRSERLFQPLAQPKRGR